jgi:hypothetical protein
MEGKMRKPALGCAVLSHEEGKMPRKLKVFRTPIGFDDAYVAATSRKAALAAWGSAADLFARGAAEEVTDPKLTAQPLKHPGEVIRVSRGDLKAQLKALGPRRKPAGRKAVSKASSMPARPSKPVRAKAPPRRDKVDRAEAALDAAREEQTKERAAIEAQIAALEGKLDALRRRQAKAIARLEDRSAQARADYRAALDDWSG